eukprot:scaffold7120_cov60-Attheya_sp.AAC.3
MANVAWRSALARCGLTREAIHAINEEGYVDTDDLNIVTKDTVCTLVNNLRKRKEIIVPVPNPNHVTARSGSAFHHWIRIRSDRGESIASGLFQAPELKASI